MNLAWVGSPRCSRIFAATAVSVMAAMMVRGPWHFGQTRIWAGCSKRRVAEPVHSLIQDVMPIDRARAIAVHAATSPDKSVVERIDLAGGPRWHVELPRYAGSRQVTGLVTTPDVVQVRVVSAGQAELVALDLRDGRPVASLQLTQGWPESESGHSLPRAMSVAGRDRAYQLVGGEKRSAVVAVSLRGDRELWRHPIAGRIDLGVEAGDELALVVGGKILRLDGTTGTTRASPADAVEVAARSRGPYSLTSDLAALVAPAAAPPPQPVEVVFDPGARTLTSFDRANGRRLGSFDWPVTAAPPEPHHYKDGVVWIAFPNTAAALDARSLEIKAATQ